MGKDVEDHLEEGHLSKPFGNKCWDAWAPLKITGQRLTALDVFLLLSLPPPGRVQADKTIRSAMTRKLCRHRHQGGDASPYSYTTTYFMSVSKPKLLPMPVILRIDCKNASISGTLVDKHL
jgi:hypothetical protein